MLVMGIKTLLVCATMALAAWAADKPAPKEKPLPGPYRVPKEITLSAEQQKKLQALAEEFQPRQDALKASEEKVYTPEQRAAMEQAREAARQAGKKGKEAGDAVKAAVQLSPKQEEQLAEIGKQRKALDEQIRARIVALLTPEQKELYQQKGPGKPKGPPKAKGNAAGADK
jgi:hypothetical protein